MVSKDLPRNPRIYKKLWLIPIFIVAANAMQFEKKKTSTNPSIMLGKKSNKFCEQRPLKEMHNTKEWKQS